MATPKPTIIMRQLLPDDRRNQDYGGERPTGCKTRTTTRNGALYLRTKAYRRVLGASLETLPMGETPDTAVPEAGVCVHERRGGSLSKDSEGKMTQQKLIKCPKCGHRAARYGGGRSGRPIYQKYKCNTMAGCGHEWLDRSQVYPVRKEK